MLKEKIKLILLGKIISAHGVKGNLILSSYTQNPKNITKYVLYDENLNHINVRYKTKIFKNSKTIISIDSVNCRNNANKWVNTELYTKEENFIKNNIKDEFYVFDLIGKKVNNNSKLLGHVCSVYNFGAGDIIEIEFLNGVKRMFAFSKETFPEVNEEELLINLNE